MSMITLRCPSCGATVQLPPGRREGFCIYCGNPVRQQMSDAEISSTDKDKEFITTVNAAVACISHGDYKTALEYADKALAIHPGMPAPVLIKGVCYLPKDFKRAASYLEIANSVWAENGSVALSDKMYMEIMSAFANNYLDEKETDLKRMIETIRGAGAGDIENMKIYEYRKRLNDYFTIPDLKDHIDSTVSEFVDYTERTVRFTGQLTEDNWKTICTAYSDHIFRVTVCAMISPSLAARALRILDDFCKNTDMKWESAIRHGLNASKTDLKKYRSNAEAMQTWLRSGI